jgi:hypothetical protein
MRRLLIVHHTASPAMQAMFEAVTAGAGHEEIEGVEVVIRLALTAGVADVLEADRVPARNPGQHRLHVCGLSR